MSRYPESLSRLQNAGLIALSVLLMTLMLTTQTWLPWLVQAWEGMR